MGVIKVICFSNNFNSSHSSYVLVTDVSDHYPILISIDRQESKKVDDFFCKRSFSKKNLNLFTQKCNEVDWQRIININDTQKAYSALYTNTKKVKYITQSTPG